VLVTRAEIRPKLSPRLLEAALWAFARWLDTYILPAEPFKEQRLRPDDVALPSLPHINDVLRTALEASAVCLTSYPGEYALHTVVVRHVIRTLVSHPTRTAAVTQQAAWKDLCSSFVAHGLRGPLAQLHSKLQRQLTQAICNAIARERSAEDSWEDSGRLEAVAVLQELLRAPMELILQFKSGSMASDNLRVAKGNAAVVRISSSLQDQACSLR
jgi:hypothetical protein